MTEFNDFRVFLAPDIQAKGAWKVLLEECPIADLAGPKGTIQPSITRQQLVRLRSRHGWPNLAELKGIGQGVWQSLMTPDLAAAFIVCLNQSQQANRGMRLVISIVGEESELSIPGQIRLQELPLEALYRDEQNFLAPNPATPVSRSLKFKPDRDPHRVVLPLRLLVVVATPDDKPEAKMQEEKDVIQKALQALTGPGGVVELEFCEPPTRAELTTRLQQKRFHLLHFIGHGAFDIVGDDPSPRPHLCLEDEHGQSDPLDAETLAVLLQNSGVRWAMITACSSANPTPDAEPFHARAFDGVAQRLVGGVSDVNAVVAMQFDLDSQAAVTFSRTFYTNLLRSGGRLDEVVALCRQALVGQLNAGHRAWVTPVVYWRCKDGKVFDLEGIKGSLDPQTQKKLNEIDATLVVYLKNITDVRTEPQAVQDAAAPLLARWQQAVDELQQLRGQLLGETLQLCGGRVKAGDAIGCRFTLRLRTPAQVGDVRVRVRYPADKASFRTVAAGAHAPGSLPLVGAPATGELMLMLQNASQGVQWPADEFELAVLNFQVNAGVTDPIIELSVIDTEVQRDGAITMFNALNAVVFVT
jgi:hypothetical protein